MDKAIFEQRKKEIHAEYDNGWKEYLPERQYLSIGSLLFLITIRFHVEFHDESKKSLNLAIQIVRSSRDIYFRRFQKDFQTR